MTVFAKIKETIIEYATLSVLGLIGILLVIVWQAVPTSFWTGISDVTPKSVLWALLGLLCIAVVLETTYVFQLRRTLNPKLIHFSGVLWDSTYNLYCPKDESPLFQSGRSGKVVGRGVEIFTCPKCDNSFSFKNGDGLLIYYEDAKENLINQRLNINETREEETSNTPSELDSTKIEILKVIADSKKSVKLDDLQSRFRIHHRQLEDKLDGLVEDGYLYLMVIPVGGVPLSYMLAKKGRKILLDKKLI
jgi:uncharacterized Zn finger protein (UPF0148 family)